MLNHFDNARLERAAQEAKGTEVTAVVVAIHRDNGQIVIHNMGNVDERFLLFQTMGAACTKEMFELNARLVFQQEGGAE